MAGANIKQNLSAFLSGVVAIDNVRDVVCTVASNKRAIKLVEKNKNFY